MNSVIWITGLSGAGKSTLAHKIVNELRSRCEKVIMLDGDNLREVFGMTVANVNNYGRERRLTLAKQYALLCQLIASQGFTVVIATISLFHEIHAWNRLNLPGYYEVYLRVPIEELRRRDPKGIYERFHSGELSNVAGLDLPFDEPESPDLVINHEQPISAELIIELFFNNLKSRG